MSASVLLVEDEQQLRQALSHAFTNAGYTVYEAENGKIGLHLAQQHHPDAVLLDIQMPVMDGLKMMDQLRQDAWGAHVPIVLLTNLSVDSDRIMSSVAKEEPAFLLVKSDWSLEGIVGKLGEAITARSNDSSR